MSALPICEKLRETLPFLGIRYANPNGPEAAAFIEELYEQLEGAVRCIEAFGIHGGGLQEMRAALAKARGEAQ